jgi:hypothetical protein
MGFPHVVRVEPKQGQRDEELDTRCVALRKDLRVREDEGEDGWVSCYVNESATDPEAKKVAVLSLPLQ